MPVLPSAHALAALLLAVAMFYGFASSKARVEIVCLLTICAIALGLYVVPLPGTDETHGLELAFSGFGHHALVTICALMVLGRGLVVTGALEPATRALRRVWRLSRHLGLLMTLLIAMAMSMFVNDTPVLVLLLPILVQLAGQGGMPASRTLIPVNAAVLVGGMATSIGTSTNLLVVSIAADLGMPQFGVFDFTPIVLMAAAVALPYIWLVMPRLLPDNTPTTDARQRAFRAVLRFDESSAAIGKTVRTLLERTPVEISVQASPDIVIDARTQLIIAGPHEALQEFARTSGGTTAPRWLIDRLRRDANISSEDLSLFEMTVTPDSRLIGLTLQQAGIENVAVLGVHRTPGVGRSILPLHPDGPFLEGDVLIALGTRPAMQAFADWDGLLILDGGKDMPRSAKAPLALAIMLGAIGLASSGIVPIAISAVAGTVLMFVTGCVRFDRVGRALSAKVIVLLAASIAMGRLILETGAAQWLGELLALGLQYLPPVAVLAAIMTFVTVLTNFASNATAAAVGTPIAYSIATSLGLPPEPLVLSVLFGCNLCYATPVAYQTNMMIMTEGSYRFSDYVRTGVPLILIMVVTLSLLLRQHYGL